MTPYCDLDLENRKQSSWRTLWLVIMHHNTKFDSLESINWTNIDILAFFSSLSIASSTPVALMNAAVLFSSARSPYSFSLRGLFSGHVWPLDHHAEGSAGASVLMLLGQYHRDTFLTGLFSVCGRGGCLVSCVMCIVWTRWLVQI